MASVEVEAALILAACKGLETAIYAEVGGGALAPMIALFKPEYSEILQKVESIAGLARFASTYTAANGRLLITDEEVRLLSKFFPTQTS